MTRDQKGGRGGYVVNNLCCLGIMQRKEDRKGCKLRKVKWTLMMNTCVGVHESILSLDWRYVFDMLHVKMDKLYVLRYKHIKTQLSMASFI